MEEKEKKKGANCHSTSLRGKKKVDIDTGEKRHGIRSK